MPAALKSKRVIGLVGAILLITVFYFLPNPEGLTQEAKMAVVLMLAGLVLWITEALPNGVSALLLMALMPYFGIFSFQELWSKFMSSAWFFILASFAITVALSKTSIPQRASMSILKLTGPNPKMVILGFMIVAAVISMFCSNIAAVTMMIGFSVGLLKMNGCPPPHENSARTLPGHGRVLRGHYRGVRDAVRRILPHHAP